MLVSCIFLYVHNVGTHGPCVRWSGNGDPTACSHNVGTHGPCVRWSGNDDNCRIKSQ